MIGRLALYGHVGDLELASFSIATTVVASFVFGFMVSTLISLTSFGKEGKETLVVWLEVAINNDAYENQKIIF
ncbi:protein TRANSPARENT TESTA [Musa troglodytarum]|uniref:Protein TRANSPARENT TESTA n=1 Tax=Musa troglodytarum TaxID=320322 RepID=A0A9E7GKD1_9LILI|nr:protein TRANSPARENT TESTA [Musa troglodytarum]